MEEKKASSSESPQLISKDSAQSESQEDDEVVDTLMKIGSKWGMKGGISSMKNTKEKDILAPKRRKVLCKCKGQVNIRFKYMKSRKVSPISSLPEKEEPRRSNRLKRKLILEKYMSSEEVLEGVGNRIEIVPKEENVDRP